MNYIYSPDIYNKRSAQIVVPIILELLHPKTIIDVGCGLGTWLSVFEDLGVQHVIGVDADIAEKNSLYIDKSKYITHDLTKPFRYEKKFDLVISLEVAEHLPESTADTFVQSLVSLGDTILFSAAIPGQEGQNHLNEQWPTYWEQKFSVHGYKFYDIIRHKIWQHEEVQYWYRQNIFVVSKLNTFETNNDFINRLNCIHPKLFLQKSLAYENAARHINSIELGEYGLENSFKIFKKALSLYIMKKIKIR